MSNIAFQSSTLATPTSTVIVGTDNILGVSFQRVKIAQGDTGTATDITSSIGLWVTQATSNWTVQPSSQFTVSVTPTTQFTVTTVPSSQATVSVTPTSNFSVAPTTQWTVSTIPTSQITASVTPTSQFTVTTVPSSQITASVTPTSAMVVTISTGGGGWLSSSTSTNPTPIIGAVQSSTQWTVSTIPTSQITASVTPTSQFTVTTVPSSQITASVTPTSQWTVSATPTSAVSVNNNSSTGVIGAVVQGTTNWSVIQTSQWTVSVTPTTQFTVTTTPSSQITASVTPTSAITIIQSTATNWPLNVAQDWNTVWGSSGAVRYGAQYSYNTITTSGTSAVTTILASATGVAPLLMSAVVNAPVAANLSFVGMAAGVATTLAKFNLATNQNFVLPYNDKGWLQAASGSGLALFLTTAVGTAVNVTVSVIASTV